MLKPELVSIIVPTLNSSAWIQRCLDSIEGQRYQEFEVIVVDNGSSDTTVKLVEQYKDRIERLWIYHCSTGRQGAARNLGMKHAYGKFIAFVDSDDFLGRDYLFNLMSEVDNNDIVMGPYSMIFFPSMSSYIAPNSYSISNEKRDLVQNVAVYGKIFRKDFLDDNSLRFHEDILYEDFPFWLQTLGRTEKIKVIPEVQYFYVQHDGQVTKKHLYADFYKAYQLCQKLEGDDDIQENLKVMFLEHLMYFVVRAKRKSRKKIFKKICHDFEHITTMGKKEWYSIVAWAFSSNSFVLFNFIVIIPYQAYYGLPSSLRLLLRRIVFRFKRRAFSF